VAVITTSQVYYQSVPFTFVASSIPALSVQPVYDIGLKVVLNLSGLVAIEGNNASTTAYQRHSYLNITAPKNIGGYGCDFTMLFITSPTA